MEENLIKKLALDVVTEGRLFLHYIGLQESKLIKIDEFFELTESMGRFIESCERVAKLNSDLMGPEKAEAANPKKSQRRRDGQK